MSDNPLLSSAPIVDLGALEPAHVAPAFDRLLADAEARLQAVRAAEGPLTWDTTVGALELATEALDRAYGLVAFVRNVVHSDAWTEAFEAITPPVVRLHGAIPLDPRLYEVIRAYAATEEGQTLTGARRRLLDKTLDTFRRNGAELDDVAKERLQELRTELAEVTNAFGVHLLRDTMAWSLHLTEPSRLAGLPAAAVGMLRDAARAAEVEGWLVTLQAPVVTAILTHADDRALREEVWRAWNRRAAAGEHDNGPRIRRILELRRELAQLLGFRDFADYVLEDRMAHDGATARGFLDDLEARARDAFAVEQRALEAWVQERGGVTPLEPWDVAYHADDLREERFAFDDERLRPFLPVDAVLDGVFRLAERLVGVRIEAVDLPRWHEDVQSYRVVDEGGRVRGYFYADLFPRPTKRAGAWMSPLFTGGPGDAGWVPHVGAICANLTPPTEGRPALLDHREMETVFHEFGHLLHHLLAEVEVRSLSGTNVAWDFVELPSQLLENWCWEREALDGFARHWQTGAPIPGELFDAMLAARTFRGASRLMRQLGFGRLDLDLHQRFDPARDGDVVDFARALADAYSPAPVPADYAMVTGFSHLFAHSTGYAAGYYSYQWAEVLDADAFTRFRERGIFDRGVGQELADAVLSRGDSEDPAVLFRRFMGRDPNPSAHLHRYGL